MELKPYGIKYEPRTAIKGQVLADFIVKFTPEPSTPYNLLNGWALNMDVASNNKGSRIGIVLTTLKESIIEQSFTLGFPTTNNKVEYEVVIADLKMATILGVTGLEICCDSLLLLSQVKREYTVKDE